MNRNVILDTDFYKLVHWKMLKPGLTKMYTYGEPRNGGRYEYIRPFGLQMVMMDHFLQPVTNEMIEEAEEEIIMTGGHREYFNKEVWKKVRDLGYFPMEVKAIPEGTRVKQGNVLFTTESTEPWFANTLNALESTFMHTWKPTTIATRGMYIKEGITPYFEQTCMNPEEAMLFAVLDFGYRGANGFEDAYRSGAAHGLHFIGSDNMPANRAIKNYYGMKGRFKSVWATEHSVGLSFGPGQGEFDYVNHQLDSAPDDAIVSIVIDTYGDENFILNVIGSDEIKNKILNRAGKVVLRPDRGKPIVNMLKYSDMLGAIFGFTMNGKGYKVLNPKVSLLQGDGMTETSIPELYREYIKSGWSAENFITGSGGGLLTADATRDTSRWAIKPSYMEFGDQHINCQKAGMKSDETKKSMSGKLKLHPVGSGEFMTMQGGVEDPIQFNSYIDSLRVLYRNGEFYPDTFENILNRI